MSYAWVYSKLLEEYEFFLINNVDDEIVNKQNKYIIEDQAKTVN
jgi:hypothetical protein